MPLPRKPLITDTMNVYHLITRNEEHFYIRATSLEIALEKVAKITPSFVSCWLIASSPPQGATIL